jgi:hypothetical protein
MPWTGTLPDGVFAGGNIEGADFNTLVAAMGGLVLPWQDFSGSAMGWTSAGTAPTIGNGSIVGAYLQSGGLVAFRGRITMGSITTFGSANSWQINRPVTALAGVGTGGCTVFDASTTANKGPAVVSSSSTTLLSFFGVGGPFASTVPIPWASGDYFDFGIVYEGAT